MYKALMIEDHKEVRDFVKEYFDHKEIEVIEAQNGYEGLAILDDTIDIILLDIMMPGIDGYEVCKQIRSQYNTLIVFISALSEDENQLKAYEYGADDYITKPYNPTILLLRIQNIFKRMENNRDDLFYDDIVVNPKKGILEKNGKVLELTKNEMIIFTYLLNNRGRIVNRDDLMTDLWNNNEFINDNALTVNISRLRNKLQDFGLENKIETRKGQGYKLL